MKAEALILTNALLAEILHPLLHQGETSTTITDVMTCDGKTIDQGVAYVLMIMALLFTYLVH